MSLIQLHSGDGIPIPRLLLPDEPETSENKCPIQLIKAQ